jgi:hypothetical protein
MYSHEILLSQLGFAGLYISAALRELDNLNECGGLRNVKICNDFGVKTLSAVNVLLDIINSDVLDFCGDEKIKVMRLSLEKTNSDAHPYAKKKPKFLKFCAEKLTKEIAWQEFKRDSAS